MNWFPWIDWSNIWHQVIAAVLATSILSGIGWIGKRLYSKRRRRLQKAIAEEKHVKPNPMLEDLQEDLALERERELARKRRAILRDPELSTPQKIKLLRDTGMSDGEIADLARRELGF